MDSESVKKLDEYIKFWELELGTERLRMFLWGALECLKCVGVDDQKLRDHLITLLYENGVYATNKERVRMSDERRVLNHERDGIKK